MRRMLIKEVFAKSPLGETLKVAGWLRSVRKSKGFSFMVLNDGSCQETLQIIANESDLENYEIVSNLLVGSCVEFVGTIIESQGKGQSIEMQASGAVIHGKTGQEYPLQKKATSL